MKFRCQICDAQINSEFEIYDCVACGNGGTLVYFGVENGAINKIDEIQAASRLLSERSDWTFDECEKFFLQDPDDIHNDYKIKFGRWIKGGTF